MTARARGDHDSPYIHPWRPKRPGTAPRPRAERHAPGVSAIDPASGRRNASADSDSSPKHRPIRPKGILSILIVMMAGAAAVVDRPARAQPQAYPATPRAWFHAYRSDAVGDPHRACRVLFAPGLAKRYRQLDPGSCPSLISMLRPGGLRIQRIVQSDGTAVIEFRQAHRPRYALNVVLTRRGEGWRAVDMVRG